MLWILRWIKKKEPLQPFHAHLSKGVAAVLYSCVGTTAASIWIGIGRNRSKPEKIQLVSIKNNEKLMKFQMVSIKISQKPGIPTHNQLSSTKTIHTSYILHPAGTRNVTSNSSIPLKTRLYSIFTIQNSEPLFSSNESYCCFQSYLTKVF